MQDKIGQDVHAPIRDFIAFYAQVAAASAHKVFAVLSLISPNCTRAFTSMQVVPEKDGIRFATVRRYKDKEINIHSPFFMRREDLLRALEKLEEEKSNV